MSLEVSPVRMGILEGHQPSLCILSLTGLGSGILGLAAFVKLPYLVFILDGRGLVSSDRQHMSDRHYVPTMCLALGRQGPVPSVCSILKCLKWCPYREILFSANLSAEQGEKVHSSQHTPPLIPASCLAGVGHDGEGVGALGAALKTWSSISQLVFPGILCAQQPAGNRSGIQILPVALLLEPHSARVCSFRSEEMAYVGIFVK